MITQSSNSYNRKTKVTHIFVLALSSSSVASAAGATTSEYRVTATTNEDGALDFWAIGTTDAGNTVTIPCERLASGMVSSPIRCVDYTGHAMMLSYTPPSSSSSSSSGSSSNDVGRDSQDPTTSNDVEGNGTVDGSGSSDLAASASASASHSDSSDAVGGDVDHPAATGKSKSMANKHIILSAVVLVVALIMGVICCVRGCPGRFLSSSADNGVVVGDDNSKSYTTEPKEPAADAV